MSEFDLNSKRAFDPNLKHLEMFKTSILCYLIVANFLILEKFLKIGLREEFKKESIAVHGQVPKRLNTYLPVIVLA